mgnify:FL=1
MASKKRGSSIMSIDVDRAALRALYKELSTLTPDIQQEIKKEAHRLSTNFATALRTAAISSPTPQAALVAKSIRPVKDRTPVVVIGGPKKVGRPYGGETRKNGHKVKQNRAAAGALLWGSEHGGKGGTDRRNRHYTNRFVASRNMSGYWIAPTTKKFGTKLWNEYNTMVTHIIRRKKLAA